MKPRARNQARPSGNVHGVLVIDKPEGPTSHDVVAQVRRHFGTRRVGHAGTLDPMATGVLVVLLGEATKLSSVLSTDRKAYVAKIEFGRATDTLDAQGKVQRTIPLNPGWLSKDALEAALATERDRRSQMPPQVSAIRVDGKRAYDLARRGVSADLSPRAVAVHELVVLGWDERCLEVQVDVSKGYYVRALARDVGDTLGVPSHLASLKRIASGPFTLSQAHAWPLPTPSVELLTLETAAEMSLNCFEVNEDGALRLAQGKPLELEQLTSPIDDLPPPQTGEALGAFFQGRLLALVERRDTAEFRVKRGMNSPKNSGLALATSKG